MSKTTEILLVDDEPNILIALSHLLETEGYAVKTATDAAHALSIIKDEQFKPSIAILDVMMPGMDGFALAKQLRDLPDLMELSIVFLTARGTPQDRKTGYQSGGEIYLTKPFDNKVFLNTIQELVEFG